MQGRRALRIEWEAGDGAMESSAAIATRFREAIDRPGRVMRDDGDVVAALRRSANTIDAEYELPFLAHAPMEPGNCFADVRADSAVLRGPLQDPAEAVAFASTITGIPRERIRLEPARLGGGFGRRLSSDYAAEAAWLSMQAKAPVQVVWTREDDIRFDMYRPAALHRMSAGLDADGRVTAWHHRMASTSRYGYQAPRRPPESSEIYPDDPPAGMIADYRVEYSPVASALPRGPWRSVVHSGNAFASECFTDELAHAAGIDPVEFRLAMYGDAREMPYRDHGGPVLDVGRLRGVLEAAADLANWGGALPESHACGVAVRFTFGGYAAQVAEISVDDDGGIRVHRVSASIDCGTAVNPSGVEAQVVGGIVFGLSAALFGEITLANGAVEQSNFHDYPVVRMDRMPAVDVRIVPSTRDPGGTGEMSGPPIAPAVANAVFAATGRRVRKLPLRPESLRA
jgi:isoquinoline 1-oxidoreductase beta subunit